MTGGTDCN